MFSIECGASLPVSGFYYPLFEINKAGSNITIVNDLRVRRNAEFNNVQVYGDLNVDGTTTLTEETYIDGDKLDTYITNTVTATIG